MVASYVFPTTDEMVKHFTESARFMMAMPVKLPVMGDEEDEDDVPRSQPKPPTMLILSVANNTGESTSTIRNNLDAIARGEIRIPSMVEDILHPLGVFGQSMNLVRSWRVRLPGRGKGGDFHPMPIESTPERDNSSTYLGAYHLVRTVKKESEDEEEMVCPGDRLVLVVRMKPSLLFGMIVNMGVMLEKDMEPFYSDVTSSPSS